LLKETIKGKTDIASLWLFSKPTHIQQQYKYIFNNLLIIIFLINIYIFLLIKIPRRDLIPGQAGQLASWAPAWLM